MRASHTAGVCSQRSILCVGGLRCARGLASRRGYFKLGVIGVGIRAATQELSLFDGAEERFGGRIIIGMGIHSV